MSARLQVGLFPLCVILWGCRPQLSEVEKKEARLAAAQEAIRPLHTLKKKPQPGDWLSMHKESGQTFAQFRSQNASRSYERAVIYIQLLGPFTPNEERLVKDTEKMMRLFFGREIKRLAPLSYDVIPRKAWRKNPSTEVTQILSGAVLEILAPSIPEDALAVLAFTPTDLWPGEDWNFVFGQASFEKPVGVWSLHRLGDPETEYTLCLQRTLKIALHETGHMLGILHCTAYECGMNGTNSLEETDRGQMPFCPECERKLWWALEFDPAARYKSLAEFAASKGLVEEEKFFRASLDAISPR